MIDGILDWSHEETDDPLYADRRDFYKVEKWSRCCSPGIASPGPNVSLSGLSRSGQGCGSQSGTHFAR
jgi:hypothetical protein